MFVTILFAFGLTTVTVILHSVGTVETIAHLSRVWERNKGDRSHFVSAGYMVRVVCVLMAFHWFEAGVWAAFYVLSGALPDIETATYFSFTSYTTIGYGDVILPASWRLLGPFEGAVGILMFGWSTGIMVTAITRIYGDRLRLGVDSSAHG